MGAGVYKKETHSLFSGDVTNDNRFDNRLYKGRGTT